MSSNISGALSSQRTLNQIVFAPTSGSTDSESQLPFDPLYHEHFIALRLPGTREQRPSCICVERSDYCNRSFAALGYANGLKVAQVAPCEAQSGPGPAAAGYINPTRIASFIDISTSKHVSPRCDKRCRSAALKQATYKRCSITIKAHEPAVGDVEHHDALLLPTHSHHLL